MKVQCSTAVLSWSACVRLCFDGKNMQAVHQASWLQGFGGKFGWTPRSTRSMHEHVPF